MIVRYVAAVLVPALLLLGAFCSALPEVGHEIKNAAYAGDPEAQVRLARMYYEGENLPQDMDACLRWLGAAADQGYAEALSTLGMFYLDGHGVKKDEAKGLAMVTQAAEGGYAKAQSYLAFAYGTGTGVKRDADQFVHWVTKAADNGDPGSQFNLAILKLTGKLIDQDVPGAKALLASSADQGYTEAQVTYGEFLVRGIDGPPDVVEACKWFAIAGTRGHKRANSFLVSIVKSMTTEQMDEAADRANQWLDERGEGIR